MDEPPRCPECNGDCAPECGLHPLGCIYGGFSHGYWLVAEECGLDHGERELARHESIQAQGARLTRGGAKRDNNDCYAGYALMGF